MRMIEMGTMRRPATFLPLVALKLRPRGLWSEAWVWVWVHGRQLVAHRWRCTSWSAARPFFGRAGYGIAVLVAAFSTVQLLTFAPLV